MIILPVLLFAKLAFGSPKGATMDTGKIPQLRHIEYITQLYVDGKPFLMLAGELNNSSSSSLSHMKPIWDQMNQDHVNTVLTPINWDLLEPTKGNFDYTLVDGLIQDARARNLHLVFLWLASWKNGMSSYDPLWVKENDSKYPLIARKDGSPVPVLSTLYKSTAEADADAFAHLMKHIKEVDGNDHTVLMMQVENEVGILGDSRDRSDAANKAYDNNVPADLMDRITSSPSTLNPEFRAIWEKAGSKTSGNWETVFGKGVGTDEIFMAYHYAKYVNTVAKAGKAEYPIPMYANAWLNTPGNNPGDYPSGCPESHVMDVWKVAAPILDMVSPDLYASDFENRCDLFSREGNPLFIPEMNSGADGAHNIFYAFGERHSLGTSPFGVDHVMPDSDFAKSYGLLSQIAPILLAHPGSNESTGFVLDKDHPKVTKEMGGYELTIHLDSLFGHTAPSGYGLVIATGKDEFIGAGAGFRVEFRPLTPGPKFAGIGSVDRGTFVDGQWMQGLRLNGDDTDQGWGWRFSSFVIGIEKCHVYRYGKKG